MEDSPLIMKISSKLKSKTLQKKSSDELIHSMSRTQIHTYEFPIGIVSNFNSIVKSNDSIEYKYTITAAKQEWSLDNNSQFICAEMLLENNENPCYLHLDTSIYRTTESVMRVASLYKDLGADEEDLFSIKIKHENIKNKTLGAKNSRIIFPIQHTCGVNEVSSTIELSINEARNLRSLIGYISNVNNPLLMAFKPPPNIGLMVEELVTSFFNGRII